MVTAQTPAIVERGVNLIYRASNKQWQESSDGTYSAVLGYEGSLEYWKWRVERFKFEIPTKTEQGYDLTKALRLQVIFTGPGYELGSGSQLYNYNYLITKENDPLPQPLIMSSPGKVTDTRNGKHGIFSFSSTNPVSANVSIQFDEGYGLDPGKYYLFIYQYNNNLFHWRKMNDHAAPTIIIETEGHTNCNPVKSATIVGNPKYFSTYSNNAFSLQWSGATEGVNNSIVGYKIEYSQDSKKSWQVLADKVGASPYNVDGTRWQTDQGKTLYFRIIARGSASTAEQNWDSTSVEFSTSIKANKPPVIESLTAPYAIYWPNKTGATDSDKYLNLSCIYTNDEFDQTIEYQVGESTSYLSSLNIDLSNEQAGEKTFTIRLYDGYDKSESKQIKIQIIKTKKVACVLSPKKGMKYTWNLSVDEQTSAYDNPETVTVSIDMDRKVRSKSFNFGNTFKIANILGSTLIDDKKDYTIIAKVYKNYRDSLCEVGQASGQGEIEAPQTIEHIDPFYSSLVIPIENYESLARYNLIAVNSNGAVMSDIVTAQELINDNNGYKLTANINQTKFNDRDYCILHLQKVVDGLTISSVFSVRFGYRPDLAGASINWGAYVCNPFEIGRDQEELSINVGIRNPFGVLSAYREGLYRVKEIQLIIEGGLSKINPTKTEVNGETLSLTFDQKELARLGFVHTKTGLFGGSFSLSCFLKITNEDDENYNSEISQLNFDFDTQVETIEITDFKITRPGSDSTRLTYLQEGANLTLNCHIKPYTAKDMELKLYKRISENDSWELFSSKMIVYSKGYTYGTYSYIDETKTLAVWSGNINYNWIVGQIPELVGNSYEWKLEIDQKGCEVTKSAIAHSKPTVLIKEGKLNADSAELSVELNENLADTEALTGVTVARSNNLLVLTAESIETFEPREDSSFTYKRTNNEPVPGFLQVKIKYETTVTQGNYSVVHESESNFVYIYSNAPTVSYRENCVGINTAAPDIVNGDPSEAVLMISPTSNKNKVYIVGNKSTARIQMDDTIGLVNFVVDGGSWTNITGGFTPGTVPGGDVDDTLAKIAYTGEIGDAVQYASEPIIIISGGGAPV